MWDSPPASYHSNSMEYYQYQENKIRTKCLCLPLRYGVLVIGLLGCIVNMAGMVAYAILQVPSIRDKISQAISISMDVSVLHQDVVFTEKYRRTKLIYMLEIAGVVSGMCLGLLVNILLIIGVNKWRRWFLLHWLIFHLLLLVVLFVVSVIFFSVEISLRKLLGVVPVLASFFFMYCWSKVYELFCYISLLGGYVGGHYCDIHHHHPPPYCVPVQLPHVVDHEGDGDEGSEHVPGGLGMEFYPVDPLSRGMMDRLVVLNRNMHNTTYVPFHNEDDYISEKSENDAPAPAPLPPPQGQSSSENVNPGNKSAKYNSHLTIEI